MFNLILVLTVSDFEYTQTAVHQRGKLFKVHRAMLC